MDSIKRGLELRETLKKDNKILVADFSDTLQGIDTSRVIELMPNVHTKEYVFRAKVNVKKIDPIAAREYKTEFVDIKQMSPSQIEELVRAEDFDFPLWFKHHKDFSMERVLDYNSPFILQVAGCNFHDGSSSGGCWYCFVDDTSNDGKVCKGKAYLSSEDAIDSMLAAREKIKEAYKKHGHNIDIKVMRVSGGEPIIVLDWVHELWKQIKKRNLDFVGQFDTNLSTGIIVDEFEKRGIFEKNILEKLAEYPIKVLTAIKGTDNQNLQSNVQAETTLEQQRYSLIRIIRAGFDAYPQLYNPNPLTLENYLENMDKEIKNFSLRAHIGPLKIYSPTEKRLTIKAQRLGINPQEFIARKKQEWDDNYRRACEVMNNYLWKHYGIGYKETTRSDITLKLKN